MRTRRIGAYVGIDPTASSLHIGHLVPLMPLFWMYMHGYTAISLIGGSTAKIGDPTDRLQSRTPMTRADQTMNIVKIHEQLKRLWSNLEEQARKRGYEKKWSWNRGIVNNNAWWNSQPMLEILRRVGSALRIGPMLSRDTVKNKMTKGDGMSFAEFSYPIMQGWDWFQLLFQKKVQMQIGGSDQFGNIIAGIEVVKAARDSDPNPDTRLPAESVLDDPVGFTVPLLTTASGAKFGKSAGNAVWLDPFQTSVFDLYGYFVQRPDADVEKMLKFLTFMPLSEIAEVMSAHNVDLSKRVAQHRLALEVTTFIHGGAEAAKAREQHRLMFGKGGPLPVEAGVPEPIPASTQQYHDSGEPIVTLNTQPRIDMILPESLIMGKSIAKILYAAGLASSTSEGQRLAISQGAYIAGAPGQRRGLQTDAVSFTSIKLWFPQETQKYLIDGNILILRKGKHNIRVIKMVSDEEYKQSGETYPGMPGTGKVRQLKKSLQQLKEGLVSAKEMEEKLENKWDSEEPEPVLIFPEDKGRQQLKLESELKDEIAKQKESQASEKSEDK